MREAQTSWTGLMQQIAARERSIESANPGATQYEPDNPFWDAGEIEQFLLDISQRTLRTLPEEMLQSTGSTAIVQWEGIANGPALPLNTIGILGALIDVGAGAWRPAQRVSGAQWVMTQNAGITEFVRYTLIGGNAVWSGVNIRLTLLVEPELDVWQSDETVLPPAGTEEARVSWVHEKLMVLDFLPGGRI